MAVTVHVSRLRTGSPAVVISVRSLRRVATTSPTWTCSPPAIGAARVAVEVAGVEPGGLDGAVDGVDVVVRRGDERDRLASLVVVDPRRGHPFEVGVEGAGDDPAVGFVGVEGARVAGSQQQRRGGFPAVGEAVQAFELVDAAVGAQLGEQAATADGLQLAVVTDEDEPPPVAPRRA